MALIYIDDGYPESVEYSTNYHWADPADLTEALRNAGCRDTLVIHPPREERDGQDSSAAVEHSTG